MKAAVFAGDSPRLAIEELTKPTPARGEVVPEPQCRALGGRVWYEPADGGGACFHVALPSPRTRSRE